MSGPRGRERKRKKVVKSDPRGKLLTVRSVRGGETKTVYASDFHGSKWKDYTIIS